MTLNVAFLFRYVWANPSKAQDILKNILAVCLSLGWTFLILEGCFYTFAVSSDGFAQTLAAKRWFANFWSPVNSFGYRDIEHSLNRLEGKKKLFVVGDSFVAGHGVDDYRDRFSNVLGTQLGDEWEVFNIARNGWDTKDEFHAVRDFPVLPDVMVLSYFVNDIDGAAARVWKQKPPSFIEQPHRLLGAVLNRSHLINFFYWRVYRFQNSEEMASGYYSYLEKAYGDEEVWVAHEQELRRIVDWTREHEVRLVTVVFPTLASLDWSREFTQKTVGLFHTMDVPAIDLAEILRGRDPQELVVNRLDAHPSVGLHAEVASLIHGQLAEEGIVQTEH